jgi:hypothetical protein
MSVATCAFLRKMKRWPTALRSKTVILEAKKFSLLGAFIDLLDGFHPNTAGAAKHSGNLQSRPAQRNSNAREADMLIKKYVSGSINVNILLAFSFGVIFLFLLLIFSIMFPNLSDQAKQVYVTILAIAAAGVGAVIPGMLNVRFPFAEAGGALAVFLLVYLNEPAIVNTVESIIIKDEDPTERVEAYLSLVRDGDLESAWDTLDDVAKGFVIQDKSEFIAVYEAFLGKVGDPLERKKTSTNGFSSPSGYPSGAYRALTYTTMYSKGDCYLDTVVVRAENSSSDWRVFNHAIAPLPVDCPVF